MSRINQLVKEVKNLKREIQISHIHRKRIYTVKEAAIVLGVSVSQIQKLVASGEITHSKPTGKIIFIQRRDLITFSKKNTIKSEEEINTLVSNTLLNLKN